MDARELGQSINRLADELEATLAVLQADYPADREWTEAEVHGLQYRLAVLGDKAKTLQAATV